MTIIGQKLEESGQRKKGRLQVPGSNKSGQMDRSKFRSKECDTQTTKNKNKRQRLKSMKKIQTLRVDELGELGGDLTGSSGS